MNAHATYRYDVFVSYRHKELDRAWAKWLVESLETFRVPKGLVEEDLSPAESAAREAYEEAGIMGEVLPEPVGCYSYKKWGGTCEVEVYLLEVDTLYEDWPEREYRERKWLTGKEALAKVDDRVPRKLLKAALTELTRHGDT